MQRIYWVPISTIALGLLSCGKVGIGPEASAFAEADTAEPYEIPSTAAPLDSELLDAVRQNDSQRALSLLNAGANVNVVAHKGFTVLTTALANLDLALIDLLLNHGAFA